MSAQAAANRNREVPEAYSTQRSAQIIALDTGILHGPAHTILAAKRAVEAGAGALNVDAVLSGRLFLRIHTRGFTMAVCRYLRVTFMIIDGIVSSAFLLL